MNRTVEACSGTLLKILSQA
uniref:Uncharacterized protein n=1 Tax=Anguilla anguilla TaxID=7936 RepID=A0A0E9QI35_ANGAN